MGARPGRVRPSAFPKVPLAAAAPLLRSLTLEARRWGYSIWQHEGFPRCLDWRLLSGPRYLARLYEVRALGAPREVPGPSDG